MSFMRIYEHIDDVWPLYINLIYFTAPNTSERSAIRTTIHSKLVGNTLLAESYPLRVRFRPRGVADEGLSCLFGSFEGFEVDFVGAFNFGVFCFVGEAFFLDAGYV